jgi:hypothetical protein
VVRPGRQRREQAGGDEKEDEEHATWPRPTRRRGGYASGPAGAERGQIELRLAVSCVPESEVTSVASKDKNTKKTMDKKPAQKTLKEKRLAKKAK